MACLPAARRVAAALMIPVAFAGAFGGGAQSLAAQTLSLAEQPYLRSVAEAAARDPVLAPFYAARDYRPLWTGAGDAARREALLNALDGAGDHALPVRRYDPTALRAAFRAAVTEGDRGRLEVAMSQAFLAYAHDIQGGVLEPKTVDAGIVREIPRRDPAELLAGVAGDDPAGVLQSLQPRAPEYARLMRARFELAQVVADDGWGPAVAAEGLRPGASGARVVALRDRLVAMGYMHRSASMSFDAPMTAAVRRFQSDHGLAVSGRVDADTAAEIDIGPEARLAAVVVAMERLRWMGDAPRGARHIWVNLPEMTVKIVDEGQVVFQTLAVIGKNVVEQRTPEFSDQMRFMVVNPSWSVPRSITTKEYLPLLQRNPNAIGNFEVVDSRGRVVPRSSVNFAAYSARSFPYALRQPPSDSNALGKVKFMFPNPHNIYLHDTPAKTLFDNDVRAYSHGCIRLSQPFEFAYALLARQSTDPRSEFADRLATNAENRLNLETPVPVHLVYFTAWPNARGQMTWSKDVYGRDAVIFDALRAAGVVPGGVRG